MEIRTVKAEIKDDNGNVIFTKNVDAPIGWSDRAVSIAASKYFYGEHDESIFDLVHRIARKIYEMSFANGIEVSEDIIIDIFLEQKAAFNSPVWFNCGVDGYTEGSANGWRWDEADNQIMPCTDAYQWPQGSACFIMSVDDDMQSIMDVAKAEAMLFKYGSGIGKNVSSLRSSREFLSNGVGKPSGPLSFMKVWDQVAAVVKSGGTTRRAAKMECMDCDHPDIIDFIRAKPAEEKKKRALIDAGYDGGFGGEAEQSVFFQNSNLSVRVTDEFMQAAINGGYYDTKSVTTGEPIATLNAREVLMDIARATWECGDPGLQYHDEVNKWWTCPNTSEIRASNPCGEYVHPDNSACNLASINLMKFLREDGSFDVGGFAFTIRNLVRAQDALVDGCSYPTKEIAQNSHDYRPLGLGYANLGALLMSMGLPYDSDEGRNLAAAITSLMTAVAYNASAEMAVGLGAFTHYKDNKYSMKDVIDAHHEENRQLDKTGPAASIINAADKQWRDTKALSATYGYRNSQVTLLAPTGTIGFVMDCDTTGIEPAISLISYKKLSGGGMLKNTISVVGRALQSLGYSDSEIEDIKAYIEEHETIDGCGKLKNEHLPVFATAFGTPTLSWRAHIDMMAAVQPFLSGAISKTVNMPSDSTPEDIFDCYVYAWKKELKSVAIYRDNSKTTQPVNTKKEAVVPLTNGRVIQVEGAQRTRLPVTRQSITHKFEIGGHEGYLTVGLFDNGAPGELFVTMSKEGSTIAGLIGAFATSISMNLQMGVSLEKLCNKFSYTKFEPHGWSKDSEIGYAHSVVDYIFRWLKNRFDGKEPPVQSPDIPDNEGQIHEMMACSECGNMFPVAAKCAGCPVCGHSDGCG